MSIIQDLRVAARRLLATPAFSIFSIATLALGVGVTAGAYAAVRVVLTPPSGLGDVDRLVRITRTGAGSGPLMSLSWPEYLEFVSQQSAFDQIAGWHFMRAGVSAEGRADSVSVELVSGGYFQTLGVRPATGRLLQPSDDQVTADPVAVVSHQVWQRWFDGATDVVGRVIKVNGSALTIVGVADSEYTGLFNGGVIPTAIWTTFAVARSMNDIDTVASFDVTDRGRHWIQLVGRLAEGRTIEEGRAEVVAISTRVNEAYPEERPTASGGRVTRAASPWIAKPLRDVPKILGADQVVGPMSTALMATVVLVLLVACTNLANLMLARTSTRRQEMAVRLSLGASRWRLLGQNLAESALLTTIGGFLAIGVARVLTVVLANDLVITQGIALQLRPRLDGPALAGALGAAFLSLVVTGLGPAFYTARADVRRAIAADNASTASTRWRGRRYLITAQVAVSVLLVALAGLCIGQVRYRQNRDFGIDFQRLALFDVDFGVHGASPEQVRQSVDAVLQRVARQPGITAVSASSGLPMGIRTPGALVTSPGRASTVELVSATPEVFRTLGIDLQRGRGIDARDVASSLPAVVLGKHTALRLFDTDDVVGRQITFKRQAWVGDPEWREQTLTVVGVAEAAGAELRERSSGGFTGVIYVPWSQQFSDRLVIAARTAGDPAASLGPLRDILQATTPDSSITQSLTGPSLIAQDTLFFQVVAVIAGVLGGMALVVALAGLYGILSFLVGERTREIGIRMAVGANDGTIRRQMLREGLGPVILGLLLGFALGTVGRLGLQPALEQAVPAMDVVVLILVAALFIAAGVIACYLPARRAARVDPLVALRHL